MQLNGCTINGCYGSTPVNGDVGEGGARGPYPYSRFGNADMNEDIEAVADSCSRHVGVMYAASTDRPSRISSGAEAGAVFRSQGRR